MNLHERVFQKAEIAQAASESAIPAFLKTHKCKLIPNWTRKTVWLLINNRHEKIRMEEVPEDLSWSHFFSFSKFPHKIFVIIPHHIIGLKNFLLSSGNHNPELRCVICTGVTLFALALHFSHWCYTRTALFSANQNRVIFSCILLFPELHSVRLNYYHLSCS